MRSSIAAKIIAIVAVTIVVFSAALVAAWLALGSVTSSTQRDGKLAAAAHAAAAAAYNMRLSEAQSVASHTRLKSSGGSDMHASDVAAYQHAIARLRAQAPGGLGGVDRLFAAWQSTDAHVLQLVDAGSYAAAAALVAGQANTRGDGQAVAKVADLVDEIQAETQRVVGAVEQAAERTEQGAATVERARAAFAEIDTAVTAVTARIGDIAGVTDQVASLAEQNSGSSQLAAASTQQTSASTEELAASAQELAATAETLSRLVSRFTIASA